MLSALVSLFLFVNPSPIGSKMMMTTMAVRRATTALGRRRYSVGELRARTNPASVMIFASEVPVIARLNKYRDVEDVFRAVWHRTDPGQAERLEAESSVESAEEKMERLVLESGATEITGRALEESSGSDSTRDVNRIADAMTSELSDLEVDQDAKDELVRHFTSEIQKGYGSRVESAAIRHYEAGAQVEVTETNARFYKKVVGTTFDGRDVLVGGRVDGRVGGRVVEVKNRMRRFLTPLPRYDVAQLQTYLFLLDSPEGELVEHLRLGELRTKSTLIPRDEAMWDERLLPHLTSFADGLALFMEDAPTQRKFVEADEGRIRKNIVRSLQRRAESERSGGRSEDDATSNYARLRVAQLKDLCRERRLAVSGLKRELVDRLEEHDRRRGGGCSK